MSNRFLTIAMKEILQDRCVFPCNGKLPAIPKEDGGHGCLDACAIPEAVQEWANKYPDANVGIAFFDWCAEVGLDVDKDNLGWLDQVQKEYGIIETRTVKTPGGGYHFYFKRPEGVKLPNVSKLAKKGFELKSDSQYLMAPGSIHPETHTEYELLNAIDPQPMPEWLIRLALDGNGTRASASVNQPGWVNEILRTRFKEHDGRNDAAIKLAGYFRNLLPINETTGILTLWDANNLPPLGNELDDVIASAYHMEEHKPLTNTYLANNTFNSIYRGNSADKNENSLVTRQVTRQVSDKSVTSSREYGDLAEQLDAFLEANPEPHYKRDVAEYIGTTYKDPSFQALVRRRAEKSQIRILHGGDKIQWVNRDWKRNVIPLDAGKRPHLPLLLPFGMEKLVGVSEHSQLLVAGDIGAGKTHYGYLLADLNAGQINIRHFVNEMGESKAIRNLDDFPLLKAEYGNSYFLISQDRGESLDVAENLDPDGLNIFDYLRMSDNKEWFLSLQRTLANLSSKLDKGMICVMIQKKQGSTLGYGGEGSRMQAETYVCLNVVKNIQGSEEKPGYKLGRADILKAREWAEGSHVNPEGLSIEYKTAPKYGQLVATSLRWFVKEKD